MQIRLESGRKNVVCIILIFSDVHFSIFSYRVCVDLLCCRLFETYEVQLNNIQFPAEGCIVDYVSAVKSHLSRLVCLI